jgi:hypothetical protein
MARELKARVIGRIEPGRRRTRLSEL